MAEEQHSYPFDPSGSALTNKITGERHVINSHALKDYHFFVPHLAPFFRNGLRVFDVTRNVEMQEGIDWVASHQFISASRATARILYGSISFLNKEFSGVVELQYQTIGGDWTIDDEKILQIMMQRQTNPRITTWEQIVDLPYSFPAIDHQWHLTDMVGMNEIKGELENIHDSLIEAADFRMEFTNHGLNDQNPHNVTKAQVGLGNVENYPMAIDGDAELGESSELYMSPSTTRAAINRFAITELRVHEDREDNPHNVDKRQVGLEFVNNYPLASEDDAERGLRNDRYMTPRLTKVHTDNLMTNYYTADQVNDLVSNAAGLLNFNVDLGEMD